MKEKYLYPLTEIAEILGISRVTLEKVKHKFPYYILNKRKLYKLEDFFNVIDSKKQWIEK